jgi:hypothetical protein
MSGSSSSIETISLPRRPHSGRYSLHRRVGPCRPAALGDNRVNEQIGRLNFNDSIALERLDVRIESLQEERQHYEAALAHLLAAQINTRRRPANYSLSWTICVTIFDRKVDAARSEMGRLAGATIVGTRAYQRHAVAIGLVLLAIAYCSA